MTARLLARRRPRVPVRWLAAATALAASILLAILVVNHTEPQARKTTAVQVKIQTPPKAPPPLREAIDETRVAMDRTVDRLWNKTREQMDVMRDIMIPLETARLQLGPKRATDPKLLPRPGIT